MNSIGRSISQRMSLRKPQEISLEILSKIANALPLNKHADVANCLKIIKEETDLQYFNEFEHDFPSFCFALATGVGKTRLMGAFITYLYLVEGIRHFFILAPNLTIYEKLKTDFTPNTSKYVFKGISELSINGPILVTGETYESGKGVIDYRQDGFIDPPVINIFNISKINSEVRGGKAPRIKRLSEYIGQSYFDYLSGLDDLVLIMDESHRYRADAGFKAINELKPILGLELTATPQVEKGNKTIPFKNVIYGFPLSEAMKFGFVKEPVVATRKDFNIANFDKIGLERLKLSDGIIIHESTKAALDVYARQSGRPYVKPFMLVVAEDTKHADNILELIKSNDFYDGRYAGTAITVHSNQSSADQEEMIKKLLEVEDPKNPTEIVIHVSKLSEGWDVTNLYTIVPLRAANSKTLVEQSIGRGLRLPYGIRTGVKEIDTLTIVSHDKFQEILEEARRSDSIIRGGIVIGEDIPDVGIKSHIVEPSFLERKILEPTRSEKQWNAEDLPKVKASELALNKKIVEVIKYHERLTKSSDLSQPEVQKQIIERVKEEMGSRQYSLEGFDPLANLAFAVQDITDAYINLIIDIPKIVVVPKGDVQTGFLDFDLDPPKARFQPVDQEILLQSLETDNRRLIKGVQYSDHKRLEDILVSGLIDFNDINYDDHANILYKLSTQMVQYLNTYLSSEDDIRNVLLYNKKQLVDLIYLQLQEHYHEQNSGFEVHLSKGFIAFNSCSYTMAKDETPRDFRMPVEKSSLIRQYVFKGFSKSFFPETKFDSDSERMLVVIFENDEQVLKWIRPPSQTFQIDFRHGEGYEPDFVVETGSGKYLVEVKRRSDLEHPDVIAKRDAAILWCKHATEATGIKWSYVLVPHDVINESVSFIGLIQKY